MRSILEITPEEGEKRSERILLDQREDLARAGGLKKTAPGEIMLHLSSYEEGRGMGRELRIERKLNEGRRSSSYSCKKRIDERGRPPGTEPQGNKKKDGLVRPTA